MAGVLIEIGNSKNINICKYCVDTVEEIDLLPTTSKKGNWCFF